AVPCFLQVAAQSTAEYPRARNSTALPLHERCDSLFYNPPALAFLPQTPFASTPSRVPTSAPQSFQLHPCETHASRRTASDRTRRSRSTAARLHAMTLCATSAPRLLQGR